MRSPTKAKRKENKLVAPYKKETQMGKDAIRYSLAA